MYKNAKGMKKSLFILIGVLTSLTVFSQENIYVDSVTNLKYQYYLDANDNNAPKAKLVDGRSVSATKVIIHKEFKAPSIENPGDSITYKVTSIGAQAFEGCTKLPTLEVPEGARIHSSTSGWKNAAESVDAYQYGPKVCIRKKHKKSRKE